MDVFECNFNISGDGGEFPADYHSMVVGSTSSYAYDDNLEYLNNSAISFSQLFQVDNLGSQRQQGQERGQKELASSGEMEEDWLRNMLSSEDSFDPDFLEHIDLDSLDQKNVQDEGETAIVEDVSLSASLSQVSEDREDSLMFPENSSLVELLSDGPGVGISGEILLGSQWEKVQKEESSPVEIEENGEGDWLRNLLSSEDSFDPNFLENLDMDSLDHRSVLEEEEEEEREVMESEDLDEDPGYTVEMETVTEPEHHLSGLSTTFPPTPPQSPEERSPARVTERAAAPHSVIVVNKTKSHLRSVIKSASHPLGVVKVIAESAESAESASASLTKIGGSVKTPVKKKKKKNCRVLKEDRATHNQLERERRQEMNNAYDCLRDNIPAIASSKKSSKQIILDAALDYCRRLAGKLERLERIQQEEVERRRELEEQLSRLQSEN